MPLVQIGASVTVALAVGQTLSLDGGPGRVGSVAVRPGAPVLLGRPGTYLLEALQGAIVYRVRDDLSDRLRVGARNLQSARIIAGAIIEGQKTMALKDKFARLAERTRTVPAALSDMADKTLADFDGVEKEGGDAFAAMDTVVADAKAAVAVAKDAVAQLTNSPPSD